MPRSRSRIHLPVPCMAIALATIGCDSDPGNRGNIPLPVHDPTTQSPPLDPNDPESVTRAFLLAVANQDAERIPGLMVPHPDAEWLWNGARLPRETVAMMEHSIRSAPIKRLRPGEEARRPDGSSFVVSRDRVNDARAEVITPFHYQPIVLLFQDGAWKVDATPMIRARKHAAGQPEESAAEPAADSPPDGASSDHSGDAADARGNSDSAEPSPPTAG